MTAPDPRLPPVLMGIEPLSPPGWGEDGELSRWQVSTVRPWAVEL